MSLNELLEIPQFKALRLEKMRGEVHVHGKLVAVERHCPDCGKEDAVKKHQVYQKKVRHLAVFSKPTYLHFEHTLFRCFNCNRLFMERLDFCELQRPYTKAYEQQIYELCRGQSLTRVAEMEGLSWKQVEGIFKKVGLETGEPTQASGRWPFEVALPG